MDKYFNPYGMEQYPEDGEGSGALEEYLGARQDKFRIRVAGSIAHIARDITHEAPDVTHVVPDITHVGQGLTHVAPSAIHVHRIRTSQPIAPRVPAQPPSSVFGRGTREVYRTKRKSDDRRASSLQPPTNRRVFSPPRSARAASPARSNVSSTSGQENPYLLTLVFPGWDDSIGYYPRSETQDYILDELLQAITDPPWVGMIEEVDPFGKLRTAMEEQAMHITACWFTLQRYYNKAASNMVLACTATINANKQIRADKAKLQALKDDLEKSEAEREHLVEKAANDHKTMASQDAIIKNLEAANEFIQEVDGRRDSETDKVKAEFNVLTQRIGLLEGQLRAAREELISSQKREPEPEQEVERWSEHWVSRAEFNDAKSKEAMALARMHDSIEAMRIAEIEKRQAALKMEAVVEENKQLKAQVELVVREKKQLEVQVEALQRLPAASDSLSEPTSRSDSKKDTKSDAGSADTAESLEYKKPTHRFDAVLCYLQSIVSDMKKGVDKNKQDLPRVVDNLKILSSQVASESQEEIKELQKKISKLQTQRDSLLAQRATDRMSIKKLTDTVNSWVEHEPRTFVNDKSSSPSDTSRDTLSTISERFRAPDAVLRALRAFKHIYKRFESGEDPAEAELIEECNQEMAILDKYIMDRQRKDVEESQGLRDRISSKLEGRYDEELEQTLKELEGKIETAVRPHLGPSLALLLEGESLDEDEDEYEDGEKEDDDDSEEEIAKLHRQISELQDREAQRLEQIETLEDTCKRLQQQLREEALKAALDPPPQDLSSEEAEKVAARRLQLEEQLEELIRKAKEATPVESSEVAQSLADLERTRAQEAHRHAEQQEELDDEISRYEEVRQLHEIEAAKVQKEMAGLRASEVELEKKKEEFEKMKKNLEREVDKRRADEYALREELHAERARLHLKMTEYKRRISDVDGMKKEKQRLLREAKLEVKERAHQLKEHERRAAEEDAARLERMRELDEQVEENRRRTAKNEAAIREKMRQLEDEVEETKQRLARSKNQEHALYISRGRKELMLEQARAKIARMKLLIEEEVARSQHLAERGTVEALLALQEQHRAENRGTKACFCSLLQFFLPAVYYNMVHGGCCAGTVPQQLDEEVPVPPVGQGLDIQTEDAHVGDTQDGTIGTAAEYGDGQATPTPRTMRSQPPSTFVYQPGCVSHHGHGHLPANSLTWTYICQLLTAATWIIFVLLIRLYNLQNLFYFCISLTTGLPLYILHLTGLALVEGYGRFRFHLPFSIQVRTPESLPLLSLLPPLSKPAWLRRAPSARTLVDIFLLAFVLLTWLAATAVRFERGIWVHANDWRHAYLRDIYDKAPYPGWSPLGEVDYRLAVDPMVLWAQQVWHGIVFPESRAGEKGREMLRERREVLGRAGEVFADRGLFWLQSIFRCVWAAECE
ncbi:hypothetical protein B0H67DRAFT_547900 [Lasiosphaeris hirsuta]|uniref:Uncharacterized protein n=1 Tax=Lasiosphaeris hirsuta TaxID=260670 RepID=A0AA40B8W9_9PEZI|nr:hypothetical protein B0H67DRAFT_547900 [Lasiosphaeris hirsuta]